jgi:lysophospholipid acyltransferase (LPLAT)-like uncharacterized protein
MTHDYVRSMIEKIMRYLVPCVAWLYIHFVALTSKIHWLNPEIEAAAKEHYHCFIYAFWHGRQLFLTWTHKNSPSYILVSQSKDGEYIARTLHLFGMKTIRGSSSRGGARSLILLKQVLESGGFTAITPDGPRGPQRTVHPGILFLAQKTGKPILPITYSAKRKLIFKGWDDYWVPLPFNSILIAFGNPMTVGPQDSLEKKAVELKDELNRITDNADSKCHSSEARHAV